MAYDDRVELTAASLARDWYVDVNTGTHASPTWVPVSGVMEVVPKTPNVFKDVSVGGAGGAQAQQKTADSWGLEMKIKRAGTMADPSTYDPGAEALRAASLRYGAANLVEIRYYETNGTGYPLTEAWQGYTSVEWSEENGAFDDPRVVGVKLMGNGARTAITPSPASV